MHLRIAPRSLFLAASFGALLTACASAPPVPTTDVAPVQTATPGLQAASPGDSPETTGETGGAKTNAVATPPSDSHISGPVRSPPAANGHDLDGDGIADANDKCPDMPEDRDAFEDADGCPDPDNDKDGIMDMNDQCPNAPETMNGKKDDDGCPD